MYTKQFIKAQIDNIDFPSGVPIIMHTSLRSIGKMEGGAEALLDILVEKITSNGGLLIIPTHTWDNLGKDCPTLDLTKKEANLGAFPEVALRDPRGYRTDNPTHSALVFGNKAEALRLSSNESKVETPVAPDSIYGRLYEENGYVLLIGVTLNKNTYLHSVEEALDFPGRMLSEYTDVTVKYPSGEIKERRIRLFDKSVHGDVSHKYDIYEPIFREAGAIRDYLIGEAPVMLCSCKIMRDSLAAFAESIDVPDPISYLERINNQK